MRLADFIERHAAAILAAAEQFAATLMPAAAHMSAEDMRDHLPMMLEAVVLDLRSEQTAPESLQKSLGLQPREDGQPASAAEPHAVLRAKAGFDIEQVVAEYRSIRACVLRLWSPAKGTVDARTMRDTVRFNEAIDQAVAESVRSFSAEAERWRHVFLAVLGHDLRGPLNAVLLSATLLSAMATEEPTTQYTESLIRSGKRMQELLDSLLDFSRSSPGRSIGIRRADVDLAEPARTKSTSCAPPCRGAPSSCGCREPHRASTTHPGSAKCSATLSTTPPGTARRTASSASASPATRPSSA